MNQSNSSKKSQTEQPKFRDFDSWWKVKGSQFWGDFDKDRIQSIWLDCACMYIDRAEPDRKTLKEQSELIEVYELARLRSNRDIAVLKYKLAVYTAALNKHAGDSGPLKCATEENLELWSKTIWSKEFEND